MYECATDYGCNFDNLTIYNTAGVFDKQTQYFVGTYCGTYVPHSMTFKNSVMMIFQTDNYLGKNGFEIQYAVKSKINIWFPNLLNDFFHASECSWHPHKSENTHECA